MSKRISLSSSPLARPSTKIHTIATEVQKRLYFPTPEILYVTLGTIAANLLKGVSVWTVLVGPPSGGKTMVLDMIDCDVDHRLFGKKTIRIDEIRSTASLLSGTGHKELGKHPTGGVLKEFGLSGLLLVKDLTSMMGMNQDSLREVMGCLRRVYDGSYDRPVGTDGGKRLFWDGRIGLLTACTAAIDNHHTMLAELGQRWIYYRYPESDGYGETMSALNNRDPRKNLQEINDMIVEFFDEMGLELTDYGIERRELEDREKHRLYYLGTFAATARSAVKRDWKNKEEVTGVKETEAPARVANALGQLYLGLEMLGLDEDECWSLVGKVATDSIPGIRLKAINKLKLGDCRPCDMSQELGVSANTARIVCADLEIHGIVGRIGPQNRLYSDKVVRWCLTPWTIKHLKQGGLM